MRLITMKKFISEQDAAQILLRYYEVLDGDVNEPDYLLRCNSILSVCLDHFQGYTVDDNNTVISLFLVVQSLDQTIMALDYTGGVETVRMLQDVFGRVDATLRRIVSNLTGQSMAECISQPDEALVSQFLPEHRNVIRFPIKR